jgi:hypothetical protein
MFSLVQQMNECGGVPRRLRGKSLAGFHTDDAMQFEARQKWICPMRQNGFQHKKVSIPGILYGSGDMVYMC